MTEPVLPEGFDPDSDDWSQGDIDISEIALERGWANWNDIIAGSDTLEDGDSRPGRYFSPQEAISRMEQAGILDFSFLFYDPDTDTWGIVVDY